MPLTELARQVGRTPFYAYDRWVSSERVAALRRYLPPIIQLHYAIKANPMPAVVSHLARLVDGLDVASAGELRVALADLPAPPPAWWRDAVVYTIFVDRFSGDPLVLSEARSAESKDTRCGGTLDGITERLPYLAELVGRNSPPPIRRGASRPTRRRIRVPQAASTCRSGAAHEDLGVRELQCTSRPPSRESAPQDGGLTGA